MSDHYILDGHTVVKATAGEWSIWFQNAGEDRIVKKTNLEYAGVSTAFLGLDHNMSGSGKPHIFETMIFWNGEHELDGWCERYSTWQEAEAGHDAAVRLVEDARPGGAPLLNS